MSARPDAYRLVGPGYDGLARIFSGAAISDTRRAMLHDLAPGTRVLFCGVGHGDDALYAARRGATVTVIDLSRTMLDRCAARFAAAGVDVVLVHDDIRDFAADRPFDMVVANFFLNVFVDDEARRVLEHLLGQLAPGGDVVIGDFHSPSGSAALRLVQHLHWWCADLFFAVVARNAIHGLRDVPRLVGEVGLQPVERRPFFVLGLPLYESIRARRR